MSDQAARHRDPGEAGALGREADGADPAPDARAMDEQPEEDRRRDQQRELGGDAAGPSALAEEEQRRREIREVPDAAGEALGQSAEERVGARG